MPATRPKDDMLRIVHALPPEAVVEDAMERLYLLQKVRAGLQDADAGRTMSHEDVRRRVQKWLK